MADNTLPGAYVKRVADDIARFVLPSLAAGAAVTLGFNAASPDQDFPSDIPPWGADGNASLIDAVCVNINPATDVSDYAIPLRVVKTGTTPANFLITITNDEAAVASPQYEIYASYHT